MIKRILLILLIGNITYAQDSLFLHKNDPAPFEGYLLPKERVQELYNESVELTTSQAINESLKTSLALEQNNGTLKDQKINLLLEQNDKLVKSAYETNNLSTWEKLSYIAIGVIVTGLAIKGAHDLYH